MRQITTLLGLMLLLWLGALPVAAFTRAESKAASMVTSLQAGHDFPLAAQLSDEALWAKSNELLAAFIVMQQKTALSEGGAEKSLFTWEMTLVIHYKHKGYPARIARIALGAVVFTDHLGTPFAWRNPVTYATSFTPFNPWGELLATHPDRGPPWESQGQIPTNGFTLPSDAVLPLPPMGLAGHLYDTDTGLVQMHHRYYSPRLGHFLTPDYRTPNIYDPSTFTEPYAYAAGNPMLYWDPDGLAIAFIREGRLEVELSEGDTEEEVFRALSLELGKDNYLFRQFDQRNSQLRRYIAYLIRNAAPGDTIDFSILALINDFAYENLPKEWLGFGSQPAGNHFEYRNLVINQLLAQMESDGGELANEVTGYAPFIRDGKRRVLDTGIDEAKSQLAGAFTGYVLSKGFQFVGPRIVRLFSRNSDSSFDTFVQALRHPSNSPSPEILAQEYLTNLQGSIRSGHFLSRHSPMIDMDDLYRRATKGILPDGTQSFMTNSTRFFNYTHMKEAIEKATRSYRASGISGRYSVTIDMLEDVGEGYYKKTGEYSRARKVVVRFNEYGQPITAFPVLPD